MTLTLGHLLEDPLASHLPNWARDRRLAAAVANHLGVESNGCDVARFPHRELRPMTPDEPKTGCTTCSFEAKDGYRTGVTVFPRFNRARM